MIYAYRFTGQTWNLPNRGWKTTPPKKIAIPRAYFSQANGTLLAGSCLCIYKKLQESGVL